ncbi:hypothetical protein KKF82_07305 [Patescibacteria group bacterium]|nr:hypothetical protein [Patescibacteria group bacterium]
MKYFEDLLNKIKRRISGYKKMDINVSLHFFSSYNERKESQKEWERFVKEYNPVLKKTYGSECGGDPELSMSYYYVAELQIAGLEISAFSPQYPNPEFNQEKWDEREKKRGRCREKYQEFLKEKKELGCMEQ